MAKIKAQPKPKAASRSAHLGCGKTHELSLENALSALKSAGFKLTQPRMTLLKAIQHQHSPFTAEEIHRETQKGLRVAKLDLVTVYRSLTTFVDLRLIERVDLGDGVLRYETRDSSGAHHHHFICRACSRIEPLKNCEVTEQEAVLSKAGYTELSHRLEFFGLCPRCSSRT